MALTQAEVLQFLLQRGGQVRNAELLSRFRPSLQSEDPAERACNRELFKKFVTSVAAVRDEDGVKLVVLRKKYWHLLPEQEGGPGGPGGTPHSSSAATAQDELAPSPRMQQPEVCPVPSAGGRCPSSGKGDLLERADDSEARGPRESVFALVARIDLSGPVPNPQSPPKADKEAVPKPCMLPVRCNLDPIAKEKLGPPRSPHIKRRQLEEGSRSPHAKRASKTPKAKEESRYPEAVPLDAAEHQWLVKTTSGHWTHHLHGLLLTDVALAEKRDFMTGFTALHWAAKSGNTEMVSSVIDVARKCGSTLNVDIKSYGGYTPLHVAAMHGREEAIFLLVWQYNARVDLRDYSGKKPLHYLKKGSTVKARAALNDPRATGQTIPPKKHSRVAASLLGSTSTFLGVLPDDAALHDLAKGLKKAPTLNKLFSASTGPKKRSRLRGSFPSITSLAEDADEDGEAPTERRRPMSDFFTH